MMMMGLLAACATHHSHLSATQQAIQYKDNARGDYAPPGPPSDPWGPYIAAASQRFDVPTSWIRSVIHVESGGNEYINGQLVTSGPGAMGLMQLMPDTYQELEAQYGLGDDPYNPRDNIMAGTAYLREMYDLFGSPGFLAAYNAGPQRLNQYLTDGRPLPSETTHYLAMIEPHIQGDMPGGRSPADQFAMNSMTAPSAAPYNGGGASDPNSLANTGGGLVGSPGYLGGSSHSGGATMVAMNQVPTSAPVAAASSDSGDDSSTDALNAQQVTDHSAGLLANGGGAVPADLMVASNAPRPTAAQVDQQEAAADAAVASGQPNLPAIQQAANYQPAVGGYQPAVVEQSAVNAAPLPAVKPTFQVAPDYQNAAAPAAAVPNGTRLAQNNLPAPPPPMPAYTRPRVIASGGVQDLSSEVNQPMTSTPYQPRAATGLHLIAPAEAAPMPAFGGGQGSWGIQVGAYGSANDARHAVEVARHTERYQLAAAHSIVMPVQVSQRTLYRARLGGLSQSAAVNACQDIKGRTPCMVLSPDAIGD